MTSPSPVTRGSRNLGSYQEYGVQYRRQMRENPKAERRSMGRSFLAATGGLVLFGAIGFGLMHTSRASAPDKTRCLDRINELRTAVAQVKELDEDSLDTLEIMTMKREFVPNFEKNPAAKEVKTAMEKRAELNQVVREKWEAWKSCSEGMQK